MPWPGNLEIYKCMLNLGHPLLVILMLITTLLCKKTASLVNWKFLLFHIIVDFREGKPSDLDLNELAGKIGTKWNNLGLQLGIRQDVLSGIETNGKDRPYEMSLRWRDTTSSNALYHDLYHALCSDRVGLDNVAREFCCKETT